MPDVQRGRIKIALRVQNEHVVPRGVFPGRLLTDFTRLCTDTGLCLAFDDHERGRYRHSLVNNLLGPSYLHDMLTIYCLCS